MDKNELKGRTFEFASSVVELTKVLPDSTLVRPLRDQLLRAGTSVGANYRAACRAKSTADFISKMTTVEEECDECLFWLDLLERHFHPNSSLVDPLRKEANELLSIVVASIRTAKRNA